eukprot:TRINITY_DN54862_c0_g1_i1.p1 TRINITY_DN54862_c0_g1~~TRINITY_DN54862_c0_g1_i1.p1  ORF type:complete len:247 (+),score=64.01 TRINITY_DN54862_c0_g1_i1:188-928(+)
MKGQIFWPEDCSQDIVYPVLAMIMKPPIAAFGAAGCGQQPKNHLGAKYPLPCYQMSQNPLGGASGDKAEIAAVKAIAAKRPEREGPTSLTATSHGSLVLVQTGEVETEAEAEEEVGVVQEHDGADSSIQQAERQTDSEDASADVDGTHATAEQDTVGADASGSSSSSAYVQKVDRLIGVVNALVKEDVQAEDASALMARLRHFRSELLQQTEGAKWETYIPDWHVPVLHECKWVAVHTAARELLGL